MRGLLFALSMVPLSLALLATSASGQEEAAPQNDWMVHMDHGTGAWRFVPDRPVLVPGGTVQLMVFGDGQFSLDLESTPHVDADISTASGTIRTAEFAAPATPGEYVFRDAYHPEATGVLVVRARESAQQPAPTRELPTIGVVPGGYESTFAPARLEVPAGATVRFTANGSFGHNLQAVDGSFSAGDLAPGGSSTFVAPATPGEYAFECRFHKGQGMIGTLVVTPTTSPTPMTPASAPATTPTTSPPEDATPEPASPENATPGIALGATLGLLGVCAYVAARRGR